MFQMLTNSSQVPHRPIYPLTDLGYRHLLQLAKDEPLLFALNTPSELEAAFRGRFGQDELFGREESLIPRRNLVKQLDEIYQSRRPSSLGTSTDAACATALVTALPGIQPRHAADYHWYVAVSCFHMGRFPLQRWQQRRHRRLLEGLSSNDSGKLTKEDRRTLTEWIGQRWLAQMNPGRLNACAALYWRYRIAWLAAQPNEAQYSAEDYLDFICTHERVFFNSHSRPVIMAQEVLLAAVLEELMEAYTGKVRMARVVDQLFRELNYWCATRSPVVYDVVELRSVVMSLLQDLTTHQ